MNFFPNELNKPNCRAITDTQIKVAPHRNGRVKWHTTYSALLSQIVHLPAVVASLLTSVKVAVVLLLNQVLLHSIPSLLVDLRFSQDPRFLNRKHLVKPIGLVSPCHLCEVPAVVLSPWSVDECTPPSIRSQDRLNELVGHGVHQAPLAKDNASWIRSHDPIVCVPGYQLNQALSPSAVNPDLHFGVIGMTVDDLLRDIVQHPLPIIGHAVPDNSFRLGKCWQEIVICSRLKVGSLDHIIPHSRVLPSAAMNDPASVSSPVIQII